MNDDEIKAVCDGRVYPNWNALLDAETNGYVVVAIITAPNHRHPLPRVQGPYFTKVEAANAKQRWRTKLKREQRESYPHHGFRLYIEPVWKDPRDR